MTLREQYEKENNRIKYVDWLEQKLEEKLTSDNSQSTPCEQLYDCCAVDDLPCDLKSKKKGVCRHDTSLRDNTDKSEKDSVYYAIRCLESISFKLTCRQNEAVQVLKKEIIKTRKKLPSLHVTTSYCCQPKKGKNDNTSTASLYEVQ